MVVGLILYALLYVLLYVSLLLLRTVASGFLNDVLQCGNNAGYDFLTSGGIQTFGMHSYVKLRMDAAEAVRIIRASEA